MTALEVEHSRLAHATLAWLELSSARMGARAAGSTVRRPSHSYAVEGTACSMKLLDWADFMSSDAEASLDEDEDEDFGVSFCCCCFFADLGDL